MGVSKNRKIKEKMIKERREIAYALELEIKKLQCKAKTIEKMNEEWVENHGSGFDWGGNIQ